MILGRLQSLDQSGPGRAGDRAGRTDINYWSCRCYWNEGE